MVETKENKIIEKEINKVEKRKETIAEAEKEIAKDIAIETPKVEAVPSGVPTSAEVGKEEKIEKPTANKKTEAKVEGTSLHISKKHSVAICDYIRRKNIDKAILMLEEVQAYKKAIPMSGEIPHRKGIMSGRFATKAVTEFIGLLKSLKSNAITNELELEKYVLFAKSNVASRPYRRNGKGRGKRTHVTLKLELPKKKKAKKVRK